MRRIDLACGLWRVCRAISMARAVVLASALVIAACAGSESGLPASDTIVGSRVSAANDAANIKIATFNIQVFGVTKREKADVMAVLVDEVRKFDVVAIQEVRDSSSTTVGYFLDKINAEDGPRYAAVEGPRLGRSSSKEQYAFIYNTDRVNYVEDSSYTYSDPGDRFEREPFVGSFQAAGFRFVLINIHTKPDDATEEIGALADVIDDALQHYPGEHDIIALGDFNADCDYFNAEADQSALEEVEYRWLVPDDADTTTKASTDCAYDRIVIRVAATSEDFTGQWGIVRFDLEHHLSAAKTAEVSDHFPVWAEFRVDSDTDGAPSS